jgi:hypothetical protein
LKSALKKSFEQYLTDKIAAWSKDAQRDIDQAFIELAHSAFKHGESYSYLTDQINQKLTGQRVVNRAHLSQEEASPGWAKWAVGLYALTTGDVGAIAMAGTGLFNWRQVLMNLVGPPPSPMVFALLTDIFLGPIGMALAGSGPRQLDGGTGPPQGADHHENGTQQPAYPRWPRSSPLWSTRW